MRRFRNLARPGAAADGLLLDGEHLLDEALRAAIPVEVAAFAEHALDRLSSLAARATAAGARVVAVPDQVLAAISPVRQPAGVVAIAQCRVTPLPSILGMPASLLLLLHEVQDPGNVGAVVRAAEACGATGLVPGEGCADPFGWKALRGAMGSTFRLPIAVRQPLVDAVAAAQAARVRVFATVPRGGTPLASADLRVPAAVLLGGEGPGLPAALVDRADERLSIPMREPVDSLNVATAAAVILYEAARQRSHVAL